MSNFREEHLLACGSSPAGTGVLARSMRQLPSPSTEGSPSMRSVRVECSHTLGMVSHRSSSSEHSNVGNLIEHGRSASTYLHPLAPQALPCFCATMDALTPARRPHLPPCSGQVSLVHMARTSLHSVTNHPAYPVIASLLPSQRDRLPEPGLRPASSMPCRGLANLWQTSCFRPCSGLGFTFNEQARRIAGPNRVRFTTDCKFASGCSPPRLAATQLPSAIGRGHLPREDLHLSDRACSQAHSSRQSFSRDPGSIRSIWIPA